MLSLVQLFDSRELCPSTPSSMLLVTGACVYDTGHFLAGYAEHTNACFPGKECNACSSTVSVVVVDMAAAEHEVEDPESQQRAQSAKR